MIIRKFFTLFIISTTVLLCNSSCSTKKKKPTPPVTEASGSTLNDTSWILENIHGQPVKMNSTLNFNKGQANGSTGCNSYTGPYSEGVKGKFHFELSVITKKKCDSPEIMQQEQRFTDMMKVATTFSLNKGKLILKDATGTVTAAFKEQSQELRGTQWKVVRYNDGQGGMVDVVSKGGDLTARFGTDGQLSGSGGCNSYVANYTFLPSARSFSFQMIMMTTKQCAPDIIMEQEGNFMAAFYSAIAYRIENDVLTLSDADGNPVVILNKN